MTRRAMNQQDQQKSAPQTPNRSAHNKCVWHLCITSFISQLRNLHKRSAHCVNTCGAQIAVWTNGINQSRSTFEWMSCSVNILIGCTEQARHERNAMLLSCSTDLLMYHNHNLAIFCQKVRDIIYMELWLYNLFFLNVCS